MAWPGSETFFCGGRLVSGPDWRNALLTSGLVLVPMALFCAFVAPVYIAEVPHGWLVAAAGAAWAAVTVALLLVTACTDPGVLPRRDGEARPQGVPQQRRVPVHSVDVVVNLNRTCGIYQPPRAHHCSINDDCIEKFDHRASLPRPPAPARPPCLAGWGGAAVVGAKVSEAHARARTPPPPPPPQTARGSGTPSGCGTTASSSP